MLLRLTLLALLSLSLIACQQGSDPATLPAPSDAQESHTPEVGEYDPIDDLFREGAGVIDGDVTLNGSVETDPNYDTSPYAMTQPAKTGDIAIFRVKGKLTDGSTTTLYTKQSSPSKNYSSFSVPGTFVDQYKAMFVTNTEPLSITFYNANNYNAPINAKAAIYDYNFKTQAAQNAGEPNDDENAATITDRTSANNINLGTTATRSVFLFDAANKDTEEWYKTTISAGENFSFKFTTISGRFGTWSFTMKLFDPAGVQLGSAVNIAAGAGTAQITRTATSTGTYYLQLVGTPVTKNNTNLFYNLYTITPCVLPQITVLQTPSGDQRCVGSKFTFQVGATNTPTSYAWNFGGGATPNTSASQTPTVTFSLAGLFTGSVIVSNGCGSVVEEFEYEVGCSGGVGQMGGVASGLQPSDIVVEPDGTTHLLGFFGGTVDLDPGPGSFAPQAQADSMFIVKLDPLGNLIGDPELIGAGGGTFVRPLDFDYNPTYGYRVAGSYDGVIDFRSGVETETRDSSVDGETFVLATWGGEGFQWVGTCSDAVQNERIAQDPDTGLIFLAANYIGTVDINPTRSSFTPPVFGGNDCAVAVLEADGDFVNAVGWGSVNHEEVAALAVHEGACLIGGSFPGTVDFNPGAGVANHSSTGDTAGYLLELQANSNLSYARSRAFSNTSSGQYTKVRALAVAPDGGIRLVGEFTGTTDLNPGHSGFLTSMGSLDGWALSLDSNWDLLGGTGIGGPLLDQAQHVAVDPLRGYTWVYGFWQGTVDFDRTSGTDSRTAVGGNDLFLAQYDEVCEQVVTSTWGGTADEYARAVGVDSAGQARAAGNFTSANVDFDPGLGVFNLTPLGTFDAFLQRIMPTGTW